MDSRSPPIVSGSIRTPSFEELNAAYKIRHELVFSDKNHFFSPPHKKDLLTKKECRVCFKWLTNGYMPRHLVKMHNMEFIKEPAELNPEECENGVLPSCITLRTLKD